MPCRMTNIGGVQMIACGPAKKPPACAYCGKPGGFLCDGPGDVAGKTCDVSMCLDCTYRPHAQTDYCRAHRKVRPIQEEPRP
jgi:hypothetical protein